MKSAIEILFQSATNRGFVRPTLRTSRLIFSLAPAYGKNPGAVYIKTKEADYVGKIFNDEVFLVSGFASKMPLLREEIEEAQSHPEKTALKYGRETGQCSICGRRLDNAVSIYNAIGPICAERLGLQLFPIPTLDISDL